MMQPLDAEDKTSEPHSPIPNSTLQVLVVITQDWTATSGFLSKFARESPYALWIKAGSTIPVVVGRSGLGWAPGLQSPYLAGPIKHEGDGRSPAGVFRLATFFGYAVPSRTLRNRYVRVQNDTLCIADSYSRYYNQIVNAKTIPSPDWSVAEQMLRSDNLYELGEFVEVNSNPALPGRGSCIFIHVWRDRRSPTVGCTATSFLNVRDLIEWLDLEKHPVLVQIPRRKYEELRRLWKLP